MSPGRVPGLTRFGARPRRAHLVKVQPRAALGNVTPAIAVDFSSPSD
jgi:hypothetical protein